MTSSNETTLSCEQAAAQLEAAYLTDDNPMRDHAQHLISTGVVNEDTTIGDAKAILAEHFAVGE